MAGQRIDIMELKQLIQLKRKGLSNRKIAEALGTSRNTVNSYVRTFEGHELSYQQLEALSEAKLAGLFPQADTKAPRRYEQLARYFQRIDAVVLSANWRTINSPHVQSMAQDKVDTFVPAEIRQPRGMELNSTGPANTSRKYTPHRRQVRPGTGRWLLKSLPECIAGFCDRQCLSVAVKNTDIHKSCVQIDSAVITCPDSHLRAKGPTSVTYAPKHGLCSHFGVVGLQQQGA